MGRYDEIGLKDLSIAHENLWKQGTEAAYNDSNLRWESFKNSGWLFQSTKK
jgi:hypothetical protein